MLWQNPEKSGIIKFSKSPVFVLASAGLAWWTWDLQWAGAIPALAFMAAFYSVLWMAYNLTLNLCPSVSEKTIKGAQKSALLFLPAIAGFWVFHWFYTAGAALIFAGLILIFWKLPHYINRYFIVGSNDGGLNILACRKWIFFILCGLIVFTSAPVVYYQHQYTQHISRLGGDSDAMQFDAVYFLSELALAHDTYYNRVVKVLSARVRDLTASASEQEMTSTRVLALHILQVLGKLQADRDRITTPIDLRNANLKNSSLEELDFRNSVFMGADLSGTCFSHSDLSAANVKHATMRKAQLRYMNASSVDFFLVDAQNADCRNSRFNYASFRWGAWRGSNFSGSKLQHAVIRGDAFKGVRLYRTRMEHVDARGARFQESDFRKAFLDEGDFSKALFNGADLKGASLKKANLKEAVFINADLREADLTGADLEGTDFEGADLRGVIGMETEDLKNL